MNLQRLAFTVTIVLICVQSVLAGDSDRAGVFTRTKEKRPSNHLPGKKLSTSYNGPTLHTSNVRINHATCGSANGSISNLSASNVTGTPFIQWMDIANKPMCNSYDIQNIPAGKYRFKFKDQSGADTLFSDYFIVERIEEVIINTDNKIISPAGCNSEGSIRNIQVTGADFYKWINVGTSGTAGTEHSLKAVPAGQYQLTAGNTHGCSVSSPVLTIPQVSFIPISVTGIQSRNAVCGENNGSIRITRFDNDSAGYSFRWIDSVTGKVSGSGTALYSLGAGTNILFATDSNGCENAIFKGTIHAYAKPYFDLSALVINDDQCSQNEASIKGIKVKGLLPGGEKYSWVDMKGDEISNSCDLRNITGGKYRLTVTDANACVIETPFIEVANQTMIKAPQYDELIVPKNSAAVIAVRNYEPGTYMLYRDSLGMQLIDRNTTGSFTTGLLTDNKLFFVRLAKGNCNSPLSPVKIGVIEKSFFAIPSAFTPNGDGLNDLLNVKVVGFLTLEAFQIYNRNGELVFATKTLGNGWDGRYRGAVQSASAYVWLARGVDANGKPVTAKGSFLLIK
jgi:gliding motility-associated-like protein